MCKPNTSRNREGRYVTHDHPMAACTFCGDVMGRSIVVNGHPRDHDLRRYRPGPWFLIDRLAAMTDHAMVGS